MKAWQLLLAVGAVVISVGITSTASAVLPGTLRNAGTIPAGADWYIYFELDLFLDGSVHVEYAETTGRTIDTFVYDRFQYNAYATGGFASSIRSVPNSARGSFDVSLPGSGKYFVVFDHGSGFEGVEQRIQATITISGIRPIPFAGGAVLLAIGAILELIASWRKQNPAPARPSIPPREVVMFEEPKPRRPRLPPTPPCG